MTSKVSIAFSLVIAGALAQFNHTYDFLYHEAKGHVHHILSTSDRLDHTPAWKTSNAIPAGNTLKMGCATYVAGVAHQNNIMQYRDNGKAANGKWRVEYKDGVRCILDCDTGYRPSGCHIIRKDGPDNWNHNIPTCEEDSWLVSKKTACFAAVAGAVAASPLLLNAFGFTATGVAAGSVGAKWMSYIGNVSKGSWFAWLQSLGMKGISETAMAELRSKLGGACDELIDVFSENPCEQE